MINHLWSVFKPEYLSRVLGPFVLFSYIPFIIISLNTAYIDENGVPTLTNLAEFMEYLMLLYLGYSMWIQWEKYKEILTLKALNLPILNNIFILIAIMWTIYFTWSAAEIESRTKILEDLRDIYVLGLLTQTVMLLNYIRVFSYLATFVRALV